MNENVYIYIYIYILRLPVEIPWNYNRRVHCILCGLAILNGMYKVNSPVWLYCFLKETLSENEDTQEN